MVTSSRCHCYPDALKSADEKFNKFMGHLSAHKTATIVSLLVNSEDQLNISYLSVVDLDLRTCIYGIK